MVAANLEQNPAEMARDFIKEYLETGRLPAVSDPLPPGYRVQSGVFVCLKKAKELRGCIGTVEPVRPNLAEEIAANAVSAAVRDPRFPPLSREELPEISVSVDILGPMEPVDSKEELDPKKYGVLVRSGLNSGLLLPDLEGVNTAEEQVKIARSKAGIPAGKSVELFRFTVTRYEED